MANRTKCACPECEEIIEDGGSLCPICDPYELLVMVQEGAGQGKRRAPVLCDKHFEEHVAQHGSEVTEPMPEQTVQSKTLEPVSI